MRLADVGVEQGGGNLVVAQQLLQGGQVGAGLEQVGGVTVPECVHARLLGEPAGQDGPVSRTLGHAGAEVASRRAAGEDPLLGTVVAPVAAQ